MTLGLHRIPRIRRVGQEAKGNRSSTSCFLNCAMSEFHTLPPRDGPATLHRDNPFRSWSLEEGEREAGHGCNVRPGDGRDYNRRKPARR